MTKKLYLTMFVMLILALSLSACGATDIATPISGATPINPTIATTQPSTTNAAPTTGIENKTAPATQAIPTATPTQAIATPTVAPTVAPSATAAPGPTPAPTITPITVPANKTYPGKIVYDTTDNQIFVINPDGTGRTKVADGRSPLFSPDGKRIAFLAAYPNEEPFGKVIVRSVNLDGSNPQDHCKMDGNAQIDLIRWSPRNRFIAFNGTQNGPGSIRLCNLADKKINNELKTTQGQPSLIFDWTPDGDYAIWQAGLDYTDQQLYYGDPDLNGGGAVSINAKAASRIENVGYKYYAAARISPDGKTIAIAGGSLAFTSVPGQKSPLDGQKFVGGEVHRVAWSPDGRAVAIIGKDLPNNKAPYTLHLQHLTGPGVDGPTIQLEDKIAGGLDWTRQ